MSSDPNGFLRHLSRIGTEMGLTPENRPGLLSVRRFGNLGLLHINRAKYSTKEMSAYAPVLAVTSATLAEVFGTSMAVHLPEIMVQHWLRGRIFIHEPLDDDVWRDIGNQPSGWERAEADFRDRLVPVLFEHLSDEGLRDCWLRYDDSNMAPVTQQVYLGLIISRIGPRDALEEVRLKARRLIDSGAFIPDRLPPAIKRLGW